MSELEKREDTSCYDSMTTGELQEILCKHAHGELETEPDTEELFKIMEELSERRQNADTPAYRSDEEAFSEFCEHYMPKEKEGSRPKVMGRTNRIFKTIAAVLAIIFVLAVGTTLTAKALHIDIWSKFASWTKDIFQFTQSPQEATAEKPGKEYNLEVKSLQDALAKQGITKKLAPNWMPEGYVYKDAIIRSSPRARVISALYEKEGVRLIINIRKTIGAPANHIEKSDDLFEVYTIDGVDYYIFSNNAKLQAVWAIEEFECIIIGQLTLDEMKAMIDSI